jgi:hypothetical protein
MPTRKGSLHKEETKSKIKKSQPTRIMILVTDIVTKVETVYDSISEAARALKSSSGNISRYFKKTQKTPLKQRYLLKKNIESSFGKISKSGEILTCWC